MLDKVFAVIGMLGLISFVGVVAVFVMEPDLWIVTIAVIGIGITLIWKELKAGDSQAGGKGQDAPEN